MRKCVKCQTEKDESDFSRNSYCRECEARRCREYNLRNKLSKLRKEYINCIIRDNNKEYHTNSLNELEIIELKTSGYNFIFK